MFQIITSLVFFVFHIFFWIFMRSTKKDWSCLNDLQSFLAGVWLGVLFLVLTAFFGINNCLQWK